jgi:predicted nucleotidyltransferase
MGGLDKKLITDIITLIRKQKEPEKIVIYGSRANGDYQKTSDVDIAIFGKNWTTGDISEISFILEEQVNTPLKFDVVNFFTLEKESLKKNILTKGKVIYESRKS